MADSDDEPGRPFLDWFRELSKGRVHTEATERLGELVTAIQETGKKGELTIRVVVKPQPRMDGRAVTAEATVSVKAPKPDAATSLFFVDGPRLVRNDPDQLDLPGLRDVSAPEPANFSEPRRGAR